MMSAELRRRVTRGVGIAELKATLAGGLAALLATGQAMAAVAPADDEAANLWQQDDDGSDDEKDKDTDGHNHHPRGRGGRPAGYRHDRDPNVHDSKDDASDSSDDSESADSDAPPAEDGSAPADGDPAPAEGNTAPTEGSSAPAVDDASGGDNIQEGVMAPAASPVPSSSAAAPIAAAPSDVDFVS